MRLTLSVRMRPDLIERIRSLAAAQNRGTSNMLETLVLQALGEDAPLPDRPSPLDDRFKHRPPAKRRRIVRTRKHPRSSRAKA